MSKKKSKKKKIMPKHRISNPLATSFADKVRNSEILDNKDVVLVGQVGEKMSEVILDFAEPLLENVEGNEGTEKTMCMAILVWNISLMPKDEQKNAIEDILNNLCKDELGLRKDMEDVINMLIERKKKYFSKNKRFIINYEIGTKNGKPWLNVASTV